MIPNLKGKTQTELETLKTELACAYFADNVTEAKRDEIEQTCKFVNSCLPHSFVLADLFDVDAMTLDIPLEVYEADPAIGFMTCPDCEGEGWIEVEGSAWANPSWYHFKFTNLKLCTTCHCEGQVFTMLEPIQDVPDDESLVQTPYVWLKAA